MKLRFYTKKRVVFLNTLFGTVLALACVVGSAAGASEGDGVVAISGELRQWHAVTLDLQGPFAEESGSDINPFLEYEMAVTFIHESGYPSYRVPGYFAADGDAGNSGATEGKVWRAHLSPDKPGRWYYEVSFRHGKDAAVELGTGVPLAPYDGADGAFDVLKTDKKGRDLRGRGRLEFVQQRYLRFAGDGSWFLKIGADAPETLLGYADFDGTVGLKKGVPLKTWSPHVRDWRAGDPTWSGGRGKGLIGAINYLSSEGMNSFSFLTYNAGGDGDNVWPFVERGDPLRFDCSKLDQWGVVFAHGTSRGMYLHFKLQETENDDMDGPGAEFALDDGDSGRERKLYLRELVARFGHNLALNWNLGEENTQTVVQQKAMANWIRYIDPYDHPIVLHTYPHQQKIIYSAHLSGGSELTGLSLQNSDIKDTHHQTVEWIEKSSRVGTPWVVAFDEPGNAYYGVPADDDWPEMKEIRAREERPVPTQFEVRSQVLWGTLLAGGAGIEYYFGYKLPENDLICENWRSRGQIWNYSRIALKFFEEQRIPFWRMRNMDALVGNPEHDNSRYCFAARDEVYLVYLPVSSSVKLDLSGVSGDFNVRWLNPRDGGRLQSGLVTRVSGGAPVSIGMPPEGRGEDWLAVIRR